jgi:hypothetical protein
MAYDLRKTLGAPVIPPAAQGSHTDPKTCLLRVCMLQRRPPPTVSPTAHTVVPCRGEEALAGGRSIVQVKSAWTTLAA